MSKTGSMSTSYKYPVEYPLAVHTAWHDGSDERSPAKFVFVVNVRRRLFYLFALFGAIALVVVVLNFPEFAVATAIASAAVSIAAVVLGNGGGAGFYKIQKNGTLSGRVHPSDIDRSGLSRRRLRWV